MNAMQMLWEPAWAWKVPGTFQAERTGGRREEPSRGLEA